MRYAILSDVHGNLEALEAILKALKKEGIDRYLFVGDAVGYGANPNECVEIIKSLADKAVAGNHDWGVLEKTPLDYFNPYAKEALKWTMEELKPENKEYLSQLPLVVEEKDFTIVHATLEKPEEWEYVYTTYEAHCNIQIQKTQVCFYGHSHIPIHFAENEHISFSRDPVVEIKENWKYFINIGSVGQPRDGDPRACCVIFDSEKKIVKYIREEYKISVAQEKIWKAGLPAILGERLAYGE